jgi:hypothetical protein
LNAGPATRRLQWLRSWRKRLASPWARCWTEFTAATICRLLQVAVPSDFATVATRAVRWLLGRQTCSLVTPLYGHATDFCAARKRAFSQGSNGGSWAGCGLAAFRTKLWKADGWDEPRKNATAKPVHRLPHKTITAFRLKGRYCPAGNGGGLG